MRIGRFEIKRQENTKWDYIVPLSLVGLQFIVINYASMHYYIEHSGEIITKSLVDIIPSLILQAKYTILLLLLTVFLTRLQRILIMFIFSVFGVLMFVLPEQVIPAQMLESGDYQVFAFYLLFMPLLSIEYVIGTVCLILKFGNLSTKEEKDLNSYRRRVFAYGLYGLGIDLLFLFAHPISQVDVQRAFIFEGIYGFIGTWLPFFSIVFLGVGYIIEKNKLRSIK